MDTVPSPLGYLITIALLIGCWFIWHWNTERNKRPFYVVPNYWSRVKSLQDALELSPVEFEMLIADLFKKKGYGILLTPATGDGGIDLILSKEGRRALVQCKRYRGSVPVQAVREFYGVLVSEGCAEGYIITTGNFTTAGREFAAGKGMCLVDGQELAKQLCDATSASGSHDLLLDANLNPIPTFDSLDRETRSGGDKDDCD